MENYIPVLDTFRLYYYHNDVEIVGGTGLTIKDARESLDSIFKWNLDGTLLDETIKNLSLSI